MNTPAKELAHLLELITRKDFSAQRSRDQLAVNCGVLISKVSRFLEAAIDNGNNYEFFRDRIPDLTRTALKAGLGETPSENSIKDAIFVLKSIDAVMKQEEPEPFKAEPEDVQKIASELKQLLSDADDLSTDLRLYCFNVIALVEQEIQRFEMTGVFETQAAVERLTVAINVLLSADDQKNPSRFTTLKNLWEGLMGFANFSNTSLSAINGAAKLAELTGGQG